jgi:uncharacterized coiled-coil protein SlyX
MGIAASAPAARNRNAAVTTGATGPTVAVGGRRMKTRHNRQHHKKSKKKTRHSGGGGCFGGLCGSNNVASQVVVTQAEKNAVELNKKILSQQRIVGRIKQDIENLQIRLQNKNQSEKAGNLIKELNAQLVTQKAVLDALYAKRNQ